MSANRLERLGRGGDVALRDLARELGIDCQAHGFEPRIAYEATDVVTGIAAIASGQDGVALVPQSATAFRLPELVFRPLQEAGEAMMELHCLYLKADQPPLLRHAPRIARPAPVVVPPVPVANEAPQATIIPAPQANDPSFDHEDLA